MGLLVQVYRSALGDSTMNGVSSRYDTLCVTNVPGPFEPSDIHPAATLQKGPMGALRLIPDECGNKWVMFGGNLASTSDSRFGNAIEEILGYHADVVKIFDRIED